jgi:hypothetical protein
MKRLKTRTVGGNLEHCATNIGAAAGRGSIQRRGAQRESDVLAPVLRFRPDAIGGKAMQHLKACPVGVDLVNDAVIVHAPLVVMQ